MGERKGTHGRMPPFSPTPRWTRTRVPLSSLVGPGQEYPSPSAGPGQWSVCSPLAFSLSRTFLYFVGLHGVPVCDVFVGLHGVPACDVFVGLGGVPACDVFVGLHGVPACDVFVGLGGVPACDVFVGLGGVPACDVFVGLGGVPACDVFVGLRGVPACDVFVGLGGVPGLGEWRPVLSVLQDRQLGQHMRPQKH